MTAHRPEDQAAVDRREFVRRAVVGSTLAAGTLAAGYGFKTSGLPITEGPDRGAGTHPPRRTDHGAPPPAVLAIAKDKDPAAATRKAIQALGSMERFLARGDRVLVKPNVGWDRRPKFAANTNPDVVAEVVRACLEAGAQKVLVTDSPCNLPARCFDKSGLKKALADLDVELFIPTERDYVAQHLGGEAVRSWPVLKAVLESDKIINVPIAKHHSSAILSMGMKNWFGILGGGKERGKLHQEMALSIAELADFVRPVLTVLDAYRILCRNGPQGGSIHDTKVLETVAVSPDPVAVDAYGAGLFDLQPPQVPYIPLAVQKGLGTMDLSEVEMKVSEG